MDARNIGGRLSPATTWLGTLYGTALVALALPILTLLGCGGGSRGPTGRTAEMGQDAPISDSAFAAISTRISEPGGYFDTDNLISNETGYLKVLGALDRLGIRGGAYVGVGPDQNFSYIAAIRPRIAFIVDIRRDNLLQQLMFKALMEGAPTRVQFLAGLLGRPAPADTTGWRALGIDDIVAYLDRAPMDSATLVSARGAVADRVQSFGISLDTDDLATIRRFHGEFIRRGLGLRFTSAGRAPRPYYPTYRRLITETDLAGEQASYLASAERYTTVRELELQNRVIPVVGDLSGDHALHEMGEVLREMGLEVGAFYTSNVEFYLWRGLTFPAWVENLRTLPTTTDGVVIRSYFPNFGGRHPSAVPGYYATQTLQPVDTLKRSSFASYYGLVTRGIVDLGFRSGRR